MDYIKKNIIKLNFIILGMFLTLSPILFYINFNFSANQTYKKEYFSLKSGDPSYSMPIILTEKPIINSETLVNYAKKSIVDIFSYNVYQGQKHKEHIEIYFTNIGYKKFKGVFSDILNKDDSVGVVSKKTIVNEGPYLLGVAKVMGGDRIWKYILNTIEYRQGIGGSEKKYRSIEIVLKEMKFSKNNKGVAIDSMVVK